MRAAPIRHEVLTELMPDHEIRAYPAVLSTESEAQRWARAGAPHGALVVADYQVSPRGKGGLPWEIPAEGAGFSIIVRRKYLEHEEGRLYMAAVTALADTGARPSIAWPDRVYQGERELGATTVFSEVALLQIVWAVVSFMLLDTGEATEHSIAELTGRLDERLAQDAAALLSDYEPMLAETGKEVEAHLVPMGPTGRRIAGTAEGVDIDGSLRIKTTGGGVAAARPQHVALLEVSP
ncbi:MAG: hypothetical protein KY394_06050 [Actinobacteria bacterium]|nr:hypothetical protein [Actinomycetota bacterium]